MIENDYTKQLKSATPSEAIKIADKIMGECKRTENSENSIDENIILTLMDKVGSVYEVKLTEKLLKLSLNDNNITQIFSSQEFIRKFLEKVTNDNLDKIRAKLEKYHFLEKTPTYENYHYVPITGGALGQQNSDVPGIVLGVVKSIGIGAFYLIKKLIKFLLNLFGIKTDEQEEIPQKKKHSTGGKFVNDYNMAVDSEFEQYTLVQEELESPKRRYEEFMLGE